VKDQRVYLGHIRDAINDIKSYAAVGEAAFLADRMRQDAIIRKLEIIGEAVKRISETTRARRPEIPWKQIAGKRVGVLDFATPWRHPIAIERAPAQPALLRAPVTS
jgi:uncharacterized protein with HEPN domain